MFHGAWMSMESSLIWKLALNQLLSQNLRLILSQGIVVLLRFTTNAKQQQGKKQFSMQKLYGCDETNKLKAKETKNIIKISLTLIDNRRVRVIVIWFVQWKDKLKNRLDGAPCSPPPFSYSQLQVFWTCLGFLDFLLA